MTQVMIVDDDELFRSMLEQMVKREGYEVRAVTNGNQALAEIERQRPDLLITDILMPEKDGIELVMELAQRQIKLPIIAISGGRRSISQEFNLESARLMGVTLTLPKPFQREDLRAAITQALSGST
ncbi:MAG: response regulator [Halochromatium sp.]|nr:response regulator [Halochromatium sp.]